MLGTLHDDNPFFSQKKKYLAKKKSLFYLISCVSEWDWIQLQTEQVQIINLYYSAG